MSIPSLDLFSEIGGFAFAFRKACRPLLYCDIDGQCRSVLGKLQECGLIPRAKAIHDDVRTLTVKHVHKLGNPVVVTAGFPCQDVSVLQQHAKGLLGPRSKLVFEVTRLLGELPSVKVVILENSPNITNCEGFSRLVRWFTTRGWDVTHDVFGCHEFGVQMKRRRWFLVACKDREVYQRIVNKVKSEWQVLSRHWEHEPPTRLLKIEAVEKAMQCRKVCAMFGNSVVPACILYAILVLSGSIERMTKKSVLPDIVVDAGPGKTYRFKHWGTPTANARQYYPVEDPSYRAVRLLISQMYHAVGPERHMRPCAPNPQWVGWLMGYPSKYIKVIQACK
jgi:hypothetical protein